MHGCSGSSVSRSDVAATETPSCITGADSSVSCSHVSATETPAIAEPGASIADTGRAVAAVSDPRYAVANPMPVPRVTVAVGRGITVAVGRGITVAVSNRGIGIVIIVTVAIGRGITIAISRPITVAVSGGCEGGTDESARGKPKAGPTP